IIVVCAQYENEEIVRCIDKGEFLMDDTQLDIQGNQVDDKFNPEKEEIKIIDKLRILINGVYGADSNTSAYDMSRCTESGVDDCNNLNCVEKCPVWNTDNYSWVKTGRKCPKPPSCGSDEPQICTPNSCENYSGLYGIKSRKCNRTGFAYIDYYQERDCKDEAPVVDPTENEQICTPGKCESLDGTGGYYSQKCSTLGTGYIKYTGENCTTAVEDSVKEEELNEETCKIVPSYTGSYFADIGANAGKEYQTLNSCKACEVSIGAYRCTQHYGVPNIRYVDSKDETSYTLNITELNKIKLLSSQPDNGVEMVNNNPTLKTSLENELREIYKKGEKTENVGSDNIVIGIGLGYQKKVTTYCNALGLPLIPASGGGKLCKLDGNAENLIKVPALILGAYAQDSASSGYTLYLPEYGMYSFELGDYQLTTDTTNGNTYYIFYIETNDKKGFQMPVDPDNPTEKEDIMLKSSSVSITYKKVSSAQSYTLVKGINLVSFNFIPVSTDLGPLTAKGVIEEAAKKDVTIQYISSFDGGRWAKGYTCKDNKCSGNDFNIIPGKGYLVYVTEGGDISIGGYTLKSSVPVNLSGGWNLVGIHGYTNAYTARTLIDSMNKIDGITANNVTWWPTSKGMYEGLQVTEEQQYGFDFPISPTNGYFVRISSFQPEDSKCKSLLWNEGGTLNGACGVTK
ncbi:MAG TPA: hypothetical protein PLR67_02480, partial [Candidatus Dojkabacteria bacterium]|nr:hypothetical protein [Candidatus Dojkabacteria bacterium]